MTDQKILVTICNYNHENYLEESIKSIQNQTYQNLDICVYDDKSKNQESVIEICEALKKKDERIRTIYSDTNHGKWYGLNKSISTSQASICTAHDADDVSLSDRIEMQFNTMVHTRTIHNLCGFYHCWNEEDVSDKKGEKYERSKDISVLPPDKVFELVRMGYNHPQINHYFTGQFETAGVTAMFMKQIWEDGLRFNPPGLGLRTLLSEDSDFNFRMTAMFRQTSVTAEKLYLYRRNTSTNQEEF